MRTLTPPRKPRRRVRPGALLWCGKIPLLYLGPAGHGLHYVAQPNGAEVRLPGVVLTRRPR